MQAEVLTEADILPAAVAVARTSGLDGLTVKAVAEHLGITSPSLYYHVRDGRAALVAMVASRALEHTFSGRLQARAGESWIDALVRVLLGAADLVEEFPGVVGHVLMQTEGVPASLEVSSFVIDQLRRGGFSLQQAAPAYLAISALVSGWSEFTPSSVPDEERYHDLAAALAAGSKIAPRDLHGFVLGRNDGAQVDQVADLFCRDACRHSLPKRSFTPTVVAGAALLSDGAVSVEEM